MRPRHCLMALAILAFMLLANSGCRPVREAGGGSAPAKKIFKASAPVRIDGVLDEGIWQTAAVVEVNYIHGKVGVRDQEPRLKARFAWDDHYLYIAYETFDTHVVALTDGRLKGPKNNRRQAVLPWAPEPKVDVAEFFVSFGSTQFMWELQHNASNHLNDVFVTALDPKSKIYDSSLNFLGLIMSEQEYVKDQGAFSVKMAVRLKKNQQNQPSTVNNA